MAKKTTSRRRAAGRLEAAEQKVGQDRPRGMPSTGAAMIEPQIIEPVEGPNWPIKAEALAFMNESVEVLVHESTDQNAAPVVETWVNGRAQFFVRGQPQTVKRMFVGALARAKQTSYTQQRYTDKNGNDAIRNIQHTALRYPFSVVRDVNPRGVDWLKSVLAEA